MELGGAELNAPTGERLPGLLIGGVCAVGAGAIHAAAAGIHAEHPQLARIFVVTAVLQLATGMWALLRPTRLGALAVLAANGAAVAGWLLTRTAGISWIDGLQVAESPQFADTACALLGATAAGTALAALLAGRRAAQPARLWFPSIAVAALAVPAMLTAGTHVHSHDATAIHTHDETAAAAPAADSHVHDTTVPATATTVHDHGAAAATDTTVHSHDATAAPASTWPRPWDPTQPIDVSGVPGVTSDQEARAVSLIQGTLHDLPKYADPANAAADGYASIGDAATGDEHYIKTSLINDADFLDPAAPESIVYKVNTDGTRTLAGAMYIASTRPIDDPTLTGFAGPLMQWHVHNNLCWGIGPDGKPKVVGLTNAEGKCDHGVQAGGGNPMVHVWVVAHPCGVFAALEGVGAGTAAVPDSQRVDECNPQHDHGTSTDASAGATAAAVAPLPYDPTKPIDLSGVPGVTPEQQAAAENLVAINVVRLPQWADYHTAEAAGFKSIGDGFTGAEHYIQWSWINDTDYLDPDHPESLVYEPQPDGSKKLVSAMYMLPDSVALADVPNIGGPLMQWHIHDNLCFTTGDAPLVRGLTDSAGNCPAGLQKFKPSPMIHVWIVPNKCGPFAALEGVGAGQVLPGQEHACDHLHGDGLLG